MIGIKINEQWLELDGNPTLGIEIRNPIFDTQRISGIITYPFNVSLKSRANRMLLGWPHRIAATDKVETYENVEVHIQNTLYKVGTMKYRGQNDGVASYNFQADSGEFAALTEGVKLRELDLGTYDFELNLGATYPTQKYATPSLLNPKFFGTKNADYSGYVNYVFAEAFATNTMGNAPYTFTAMPYMLHVLTTIFDLYGYRIIGSWAELPDVQKMIIYSNYANIQDDAGVITPADTVAIATQMPDMTIADFIVSLKNLLGLAMVFDSQRKTVEIIPLNDVLGITDYVDWSRKASPNYSDAPVDYKGVTFKQSQDRTDEYLEELGNEWLEHRIDQGVDSINADGAPLHMISETDSINAGRDWTLPAIKQSGSSELFDLGINKNALRFMYYQGMAEPGAVADNRYGLANYTGTNHDLRWQGANGLYEKNHKPWIDFLKTAVPVQRKVSLNMADLANLDYKMPKMIDHLKYYWTSIRLGATQKGLGDATINLLKR